ncbi:MAG: hypothetical protein NTW65_09065 [Deltaproteobacteria bacterium]|nr:hypothetical protein [Deltaproteobacteria bacterium]
MKKRVTIIVFLGIQIFTLLGLVPVSRANNNLGYPVSIETQTDDNYDILANGLIDLLAGAYDKKSQYYDQEFSEAVKKDIQQLLIASRSLVLHEDFKKIILSLDKILTLNDSSDISKNTLAKYLKQVLKGMAPLADSKITKDMLLTLTSIDKKLFTGSNSIIEGLIMMADNNMYGQKRTTSDINTSALRSLLFMIACADFNVPLEVNGKDTGIQVLLLVDSPDHPSSEPGTVKAQTNNIAEWFIGEIVTAVRWGREGKIKLNDKYVYMDQFQAYDWLMFKKRYQLSGVGYEPLKFEGIVGMISNPLVQSIMPAPVIEAFPSIIELGGGMTQAEYNGGRYDGFTNNSWRSRYGTAGKRHKLLSSFTPIMEYWWNARDAQGHQRIGDLIHMLASLNEIPAADYKSMEREGMQNPQATFRNDSQFYGKSVLKTIEDSELLSAGLKSHAPNDTGLAPPAVDIFFRFTKKLNSPHSIPEDYLRANPSFNGNTFLDVIFAELDKVASTVRRTNNVSSASIDRIFEMLFVPLEGERNSLVTKLGAIVHVAAQTTSDEQFVATFKNDLGNLLDATEKLVMSVDIKQLLNSLDTVLALNDNPDPQKNTLAKFANSALQGLAPISDGDTIKGMLVALTSMDSKALRDTAKLNEDLIMVLTNNMYGQKLETSKVKTSELRTLLFMIKAANVEQNLVLAGVDMHMPMLSMVDSSHHPDDEPGTVRDQTINIAQWTIGEIVTALRWGREGKINIDGTYVTLDQFQAFDWVMFKKRYDLKFAGISIPLMSFDGIAGLLSNRIVQVFIPSAIIDAFPALVDLGGGMTKAEYALGTYKGFNDTTWQERYGTAGKRHKLFAFVAPLMEFSWNNKDAKGRQRAGDLVGVLAGLNEIPMPPAYQILKKGSTDNPDATFRKDDQPSVIKTVENTGLLVTLVKKRGENDIVVPAFDLLVTVVNKLNQKDSVPPDYPKNNSGFTGNTLLDVLFAEMDIKGYKKSPGDASDPIQKIINVLFVTQPGASKNKNVVSQLQAYLQRFANHITAENKENVQKGSDAPAYRSPGDSNVKGGAL